jgi:hypothetical protein
VSDVDWEKDWRALLSERERIRSRVAAGRRQLKRAARDPFGFKSTIRRHPFAAAAVGAGVSALLVKLVLRQVKQAARAERAEREQTDGHDAAAPPRESSSIGGMLKTVVLNAVAPMLTRFLESDFAGRARDDRRTAESPPVK